MPFTLGGSSASSSSKSTTNSSGSSTTELSGSSITSRFDEQAKNLLDALTNNAFNRAEGEDSEYTRENAIADSQATIQGIFREFSEKSLPEIYSAERGTGAYNATATQFLANDAFGEAVARSAEVVQQNIMNYAQLGQQESQLQISTLLDALKLQGSAYEATEIDQESSSEYESTSNTRTSGSSSSIGAGFSF